jgi:uncharacterized protein YkwD
MLKAGLGALCLLCCAANVSCMAPDAARAHAPNAITSPPQSLRSSVEAEPLPAERTEHFVWRERISSPQPGGAETARDQALVALCDGGDAALEKVARRMAERQADDLAPFDMAQIGFALRSAGAPYVWPRAWSLQGGELDPSDVASRMQRWLASFGDGGQRRCGVATVRRGAKQIVAALAVDALADLRPMPTFARSGQWITVEAQVLVPTSEAKLVVLAPDGPPHAITSSLSGGVVRGRFAADRPGPWLVQVLATVDSGPRPVLEALLHVDENPPETFHSNAAPGEGAATGAPDEATAIHRMVDAARQSERLGKLRRDERLDRVAEAHAEAMLRARRVGHDVGNGDPPSRVEAAGLSLAAAGENVVHAANLRRAHRALWASPSHRSNVLQKRFDAIGIGVSKDEDGSVWVCEVFGDSR